MSIPHNLTMSLSEYFILYIIHISNQDLKEKIYIPPLSIAPIKQTSQNDD